MWKTETSSSFLLSRVPASAISPGSAALRSHRGLFSSFPPLFRLFCIYKVGKASNTRNAGRQNEGARLSLATGAALVGPQNTSKVSPALK